MVADAEVLRAFATILDKLDINFIIKLNDRRLLDAAIILKAKCNPEQFNTVCSSVDKLDKETIENVSTELADKGLNPDQIAQIREFVELKSGSSLETLKNLEKYFEGIEAAQKALEDQYLLFKYLEAVGMDSKFTFDPSLARGLDYYTGMIFEGVL